MFYWWLRSLLFQLPPERSHYLTLATIQKLLHVPGFDAILSQSETIENHSFFQFGYAFPNRVGIAAGFDKDARYVDTLAALGFGFVEIGTITPNAQSGNQKPRLFRLTEDRALINRMGFNNDGVDAVVERLKKVRSRMIVGGNIGKNKITSNERAKDDYAYCFQKLHPYVSYFVVNVSSPNTPGLRELQNKEPLKDLLEYLQNLNKQFSEERPILLKISPDLTHAQLDDILDIADRVKLDGLIATNTTISRQNLETEQQTLQKIGEGGVSGRPLTDHSTSVIRYLKKHKKGRLSIIGVGGIMTAQDAMEKLDAGASLLQLYTGFIYNGPSLITSIRKAIRKREA